MKNVLGMIVAALTAVAVVGCGSVAEKAVETTKSEVVAENKMEIYEVHHDGRIHVFYDKKLHDEFLSLGETPFRLTRIGAGPKGETIVFGLTKEDKKKPDSVEAIKLYDGSAEASANFYGELRNHGRIYVFNSFKDMQPVRDFGHPNFFYTEIASGPKGETVVYVLNKETKKHKPEALIAKFHAMNK